MIIPNCVITRISGPGDAPIRPFHVHVQTQDNQIHDLAIYDNSFALEQLALRGMTGSIHQYGKEKYQQLVQAIFTYYKADPIMVTVEHFNGVLTNIYLTS